MRLASAAKVEWFATVVLATIFCLLQTVVAATGGETTAAGGEKFADHSDSDSPRVFLTGRRFWILDADKTQRDGVILYRSTFLGIGADWWATDFHLLNEKDEYDQALASLTTKDETYCLSSCESWIRGDEFCEENLRFVLAPGDGDAASRSICKTDTFALYLGSDRARPWKANALVPLVSVLYTYRDQEGDGKDGGNGLALAVDVPNAGALRSMFGPRLTRTRQLGTATIIPELYAGWMHEYQVADPLASEFLGGVSQFSTDRDNTFRDAGYFGVGVTFQPGHRTSLFTRYNGEFSEAGHFHAVDAGMVIAF